MFANSISVIVLIVVTGLPALLFLLWAVSHGQFDQMEATAEEIFDTDELRYPRPWETAQQQEARVSAYGRPILDPWNDWRKWL
jgi:cbb3-type cytochrome oxidase maturation protein